jgi:hypothetical protein
MGQTSTWHKRFSFGESFIMTGISFFLHFLWPSPIQFHCFSFHLGRGAQSSNRYGHAAARMRSGS